MSSLDRKIVLKTLRGYAEVNRITEAERRVLLTNITDDQAMQIFHNLNENLPNMSVTQKARLVCHIKIRKDMELMAKKLGYAPAS